MEKGKTTKIQRRIQLFSLIAFAIMAAASSSLDNEKTRDKIDGFMEGVGTVGRLISETDKHSQDSTMNLMGDMAMNDENSNKNK